MTTIEGQVAAPSGRPRSRVFIDSAVLTVDEPAPDRRHEPRRVLAPGASDALTLLAASHDVTLIGPAAAGDIPELLALASDDAVPAAFPVGSWYITGDEGWCEGDRPGGLHSILVGPRRPPARRPTRRCDIEARDLNAAIMEILVRETMA